MSMADAYKDLGPVLKKNAIDKCCAAITQAIRDAYRNPSWQEAKKTIGDAIFNLVATLDTEPLAYARALAEELSISLNFCTAATDLEIINIERETEAIRNIARRDVA